MKKVNKQKIITLTLAILFMVSLATNVFLYYKLHMETQKIKISIISSPEKDYFTRMKTLTDYSFINDWSDKGIIFEKLYREKIHSDLKRHEGFIPNRVEAELIAQNPDYPNGCESASAVMLLRYCGFDITLKDFVDNHLKKEEVIDKDGVRYGPDPSKCYAGDPASERRGWGYFAPVITEALTSAIGSENYKAVDISQTSLDFLSLFLPAVVWTTQDYKEATKVYQWKSLDGNFTYTYPVGSHTVLLVGVDKEYVYLNDPLKPEGVQKVKREQFEASFTSTGRQAVTIINRTPHAEGPY